MTISTPALLACIGLLLLTSGRTLAQDGSASRGISQRVPKPIASPTAAPPINSASTTSGSCHVIRAPAPAVIDVMNTTTGASLKPDLVEESLLHTHDISKHKSGMPFLRRTRHALSCRTYGLLSWIANALMT